MKMIWAVIRPEKLKEVSEQLKEKGHPSLTEVSVRGRGKQKGIVIGDMKYEKLPKELLVTVCRDEDVEKILSIVMGTARTGSIGDGKIFVLNVEDTVTIRTGQRGQDSL
ncbi:MAG TPA: P-II family nitrogen regulator [Thermodesulfobacteriota bacterium]|nr:P-II family nitrogen regulator [Thermodesulfobacteriota bacterium]